MKIEKGLAIALILLVVAISVWMILNRDSIKEHNVLRGPVKMDMKP